MNRKQALKTIAGGAVSSMVLPQIAKGMNTLPADLKNNINHSACQWCYSSIPLEELVIAGKEIGLKSVELLRPEQWSVAIKHGLTCAMGYASSVGLNKGFNDPTLHEQLLSDYATNIPKAADAGLH